MDKKYFTSLDYIKILFAIIIILFHFNFVFFSGYLAVEGFFIITGFFMVKSAYSKKLAGKNVGVATFKYIKDKFLSFLPYLLISALIGFVVNIYVLNIKKESWLLYFSYLIFEVFPMQSAGFYGFWATGVSWYLSAMMIALFLLFPVVYKFKCNATLILLPILAVLTYGYMCHNYSLLNIPNNFSGIINTGILRALGSISVGGFLYEITQNNTKDNNDATWVKILFFVAEIVLLGLIVKIMTTTLSKNYDYVCFMLFIPFFYIVFSKRSIICDAFPQKLGAFFRKISLLVYMNHFYWAKLISNKFSADLSQPIKLLIYLSLIAVSTAFVYICVLLLKKLFRFLKNHSQKDLTLTKD